MYIKKLKKAIIEKMQRKCIEKEPKEANYRKNCIEKVQEKT